MPELKCVLGDKLPLVSEAVIAIVRCAPGGPLLMDPDKGYTNYHVFALPDLEKERSARLL